ncbi:hypothetical protein [Spirillospora sp. NPDC029432]|uniref:hypothetical protein n=1 Tax=Spirillospora sp. NPDC029432 TaxID=3154599 RepID=UPI0034535F9B
MRDDRPSRGKRLLAVLAAVLLAFTCAPAVLAAPPDHRPFIQRINAAIQAGDFDRARDNLARLRELAEEARTTAASPRERKAANGLGRQVDVLARKLVDAQLRHALRQPRSADAFTAAEKERVAAERALAQAEDALHRARAARDNASGPERGVREWDVRIAEQEYNRAKRVHWQARQKSELARKQNAAYWEAVVANWIRPEVIDINRRYAEPPDQRQAGRNLDAEMDIEGKEFFIEVTTASADTKRKQVLGETTGNVSRPGLLRHPVLNPTGKPAIVFTPENRISEETRREFAAANVRVARTRDELVRAVNDAKRQYRRERQAQPARNLGLSPSSGQCATSTLNGRGGGGPALTVVRLKAPCAPSAIEKAFGGGDLGGVDLSTLEMRYMSDGSSGVRYSFSGRPAPAGAHQDPASGFDVVSASTADLRTWLVLDPSTFWVNLNPAEPDRIVDDRLGQTDTGRVLLEADLAMKRTVGRMIDPRTEFGARYWRAILSPTKTACYSSRMWIVPGDVRVREDGDSLYVIKAELAVRSKAERVAGMSCTPDPAANARNERLEQAMVVPKLTEAVNKDPEYAPLRRAFMARVIAQWIRKRHQDGHRTSFDHLIGTGDLGPARLQGRWRPRQVFDRLVASIRDGEFTYEQPMGDDGTIYKMTYGGVDFGRLDPTRLSAAQMDQHRPRLPRTVRDSHRVPATASDGSIWLGGSARPRDEGLLARTAGTLRGLVDGRTGILVVIVAGLIVVTFGFRRPRRSR